MATHGIGIKSTRELKISSFPGEKYRMSDGGHRWISSSWNGSYAGWKFYVQFQGINIFNNDKVSSR